MDAAAAHGILIVPIREGYLVGRSRIRKIKSTNQVPYQSEVTDVFYMSLEEAKQAIGDKYEQLAERYEYRFPKHKGIT